MSQSQNPHSLHPEIPFQEETKIASPSLVNQMPQDSGLSRQVDEVKTLLAETGTLLAASDPCQKEVIKEKLNLIRDLLDELKLEDEEKFKYLEYSYHCKNASFCRMIGKEKEANIQEKLAKKLEKENELSKSNVKLERPKENEERKSDDPFYTLSDPETIKIFQDLNTHLSKLKNEDEVFTLNLIDVMKKITTFEIRHFSDYLHLESQEKSFESLTSEYLLRIGHEKGEKDEGNEIMEVSVLIKKRIEQIRIKFIELALVSDPKELLFNDLSLLSEDNIMKRYRQLSRFFHPDKSSELFGKIQKRADQLFIMIQDCKENLLLICEREAALRGKFAFYEEKGNEFWEISKDYKEAIAENWSKLKLLTKESLSYFSQEELKYMRLHQIKLARESYKVCCKIADKNKVFQKQIQLRESIALCFYSENQYLEAQLYALVAIKLILNNPNAIQEDLDQALKILNKIKGASVEQNQTDLQPKVQTQEVSQINGKALMLFSKPITQLSLLDKAKLQNTIRQDLAELASELTLKSDRKIVKYQTPVENILKAKESAMRHKLAGTAAMATGATAGGGIVTVASFQIYQTVALITAGVAFTPVVSLAAGLATIGLGILWGKSLWKKGNFLLKKPSISEKLNSMMEQALKYYDDGKYNEFWAEISQDYQPGSCLFTFKGPGDVIKSMEIIDNLLSFGFRPDGIAYLLNLIGEVMMSGKISIEGVTQKDLTEMAKKLFYGSLENTLEAEAKKLDERINELRENTLKGMRNTFKDYIFLKGYTEIAKEHIHDSQKMPFKIRLNEMRYIAYMNLAIIRVINGEDNEAIKIIQNIQSSIRNNHSYISKSNARLEALEDFLWAVSAQNLSDSTNDDLEILAIETESQEEDDIKVINFGLKHPSWSQEEKRELYILKAAYYEKKALEAAKTNCLNSLRHWKSAQKCYQEALAIDSNEPSPTLGVARCLLNLSKYDEVFKILSTNTKISSTAEYWIIGSIAHYKQRNYDEAEAYIMEALKKDSGNLEAKKQKSLIQRLKQITFQDKLKIYQKSSKLKNQEDRSDLYDKRSWSEDQSYKILSIDGGGVRGILPALFTSELERRLRTPISNLFQMSSGTSTGAIIAAGLSVPHFWTSGIPRFSASDILDLYMNEAKNIFTSESSWWELPSLKNLTRAKYTDVGREKMFSKCFGETNLNQALIDLVIPSVKEENLTHSHLFTSYDNHGEFGHETFFEALMATTAAPTFFPPYKIFNQGLFIDGGVTSNNPSMTAYSEVMKRQIPKEKIFVLSMGTGSFIPDPFNPDLYRGRLFWAQNLHKVVLPAQEGNTDIAMFNHLGKNYQRWQVWLENPITLDDYSKETLDTLLDIGNQYIEEMYASDDNTLNNLLEFLEKEKPLL